MGTEIYPPAADDAEVLQPDAQGFPSTAYEREAQVSTPETETHWHVASGTPGYLFDGDDQPDTYDTRAIAIDATVEAAREDAFQRNEATRAAYGGRLPNSERWVLVGSLPRKRVDASYIDAHSFAVAIDRTQDPYSLPYQWQGWQCSDAHNDTETRDSMEGDN